MILVFWLANQEAQIKPEQDKHIHIPEIAYDILETIAFKARESEFVDEKSGVSARMSISGLENLLSTAERRMLKNNDRKTSIRLTDFWGVIPAITGKMELVYEGEQEGPYAVALSLLGKAVRDKFLDYFPHPDKLGKSQEKDPFGTIRAWFSAGNELHLLNDDADKIYKGTLNSVAGLDKLVSSIGVNGNDKEFFMELILQGLSEFEVLSKNIVNAELSFTDPLANMWENLEDEDEEDLE